MEKAKEKVKEMQQLMQGMMNPQEMLKTMVSSFKDMEINIKVHGIIKAKSGEKRLWISLAPVEHVEIPLEQIEQEEKTE